MTDELRPTEASIHGRIPSQSAAGRADVIQAVARVWPSRLPAREIAGLPPEIAQLVGGGPRRGALAEAARRLDRELPGWPERGASRLCQVLDKRSSALSTDQNLRRLCALLALRPLGQPERLMDTLAATPNARARLWLLAALYGTDTPAARAFWLERLRARAQADFPDPEPSLWFAFLVAFRGGWLGYADFRECLASGRVLGAADVGGDYPRALSRLGLDRDARFGKWYRQIVYEIANQPDVALSFGAAGWIRDFPGEDYFWEAVGGLSSRPDSWWALHLLRYTSGVEGDDPRFSSRLRQLPPVVLCLVSLLRPDLCSAVEAALIPHHEAVVEWLTTTSAAPPLDLRWIEACLRPWAEHIGEAMTLAAGALCSVDPPADFPGPEHVLLRRREFVRGLLLPGFDRLMDNVLCLHAARREHFDTLLQRAQKGHLMAIRALSLWPEQIEASAPALFQIVRRGSRSARRAAGEALEVLGSQTGVRELGELERRLDLASAWADAGLEGKPSRVWWDVSGYRVKLSAAPGKVLLHVYSGGRRLAGVPRAVRQAPEYPEIRRARADLIRSYRYFRRRFEESMVEGVRYRGREFATMLANPVVRSLASRLVLMSDGVPIMWTPADPFQEATPPSEVSAAREIGIAHPLTLAANGCLAEWQQRVIDARIAQPFKQVFREAYLPAESERGEYACSRFAGHPLIARRAFALLRGRGYSPGRGDAFKDWPADRGRAFLRWAGPEEEAGRLLADPKTAETVTSGAVWFTDTAGQVLALGDVDPIVLSETRRDADLLVSRAAAGEMGLTSEETLRLRATLVRYLARALSLTNIYVAEDSAHALVEGTRAMYRVHLASGSVLLENTRQHLDVGTVTATPLDEVMAESIDSVTARILAIIARLCRDEEITARAFLQQL